MGGYGVWEEVCMSRVCEERMEIESTAHVVGEDYVEMILSDMSEEELYPGWNDTLLDEEEIEYLK